jgi:hypothetical protein
MGWCFGLGVLYSVLCILYLAPDLKKLRYQAQSTKRQAQSTKYKAQNTKRQETKKNFLPLVDSGSGHSIPM